VEQQGAGRYLVKLEEQGTSLNKDFLCYYRLEDNLPGRVELIPYRADPGKPGTYMMVVTPGMDLKPLDEGADYTFVLDVSGSMSAKISTLARGVVKALGEMTGKDRFRIITFSSNAAELTSGWVQATKENVGRYASRVEGLQAKGSTNLYDALRLALKSLDDDRATSIILVTDAVTNTGIVDAPAFHKLMKTYDVRVFGFVMGNSGNWPLMRVICEATGGFSAGVSNDDDIIGQILLAKSKIVYECLHHAELKISGVKVFDHTDEHLGKVYRGQQLVLFGRYEEGGTAKVALNGRMTGEDRTYTTEFDFPDSATDHPEIERLWALDRVEHLQYLADTGRMDAGESRTAVQDLGVTYQLVTDETSMVVLSDESFDERGIERKNKERIEIERRALARRAENARNGSHPIPSRRADRDRPMFTRPAPSSGGSGGGALDPASLGLALGIVFLAGSVIRFPRRKNRKQS
jgi:Ca-activated chloride channel family protein